MTKALANVNTNVSMMGETFKYAAPIAGALGYTAEVTALAIGLLSNADSSPFFGRVKEILKVCGESNLSDLFYVL